jgi:hypothetical protein
MRRSAAGLELSVFAHQISVGAKIEQGAIKGASAELTVPLDDAYGHVGVGLPGGFPQRVRGRPGNFNSVFPVPLPSAAPFLFPAAYHDPEAEPPGIGRDKGFGEKDQLCALGCHFGSQTAGLFHRGFPVEQDRRGLHHGYFYGSNFPNHLVLTFRIGDITKE